MAALAVALRINPRHADAHGHLGSALVAAAGGGDLESDDPAPGAGQLLPRAVEHLRAALRLRPAGPAAMEPLVNLCGAVLGLGRAAEAAGHCEAALAIDGRSADAMVNLGAALQALGKYPEALERFQRAAGMEPTHAAARANADSLGGWLASQRK